MERARYNTGPYSNQSPPLKYNVKPSNFWGSHQLALGPFLFSLVADDSFCRCCCLQAPLLSVIAPAILRNLFISHVTVPAMPLFPPFRCRSKCRSEGVGFGKSLPRGAAAGLLRQLRAFLSLAAVFLGANCRDWWQCGWRMPVRAKDLSQ